MSSFGLTVTEQMARSCQDRVVGRRRYVSFCQLDELSCYGTVDAHLDEMSSYNGRIELHDAELLSEGISGKLQDRQMFNEEIYHGCPFISNTNPLTRPFVQMIDLQ